MFGTIQDVTERKQVEQDLKRQQKLLLTISSGQLNFIAGKDDQVAFDDLVSGILDITESEYGFIGEVLFTAEGQPYLKTHAITNNIAWNEETRCFYEEHAPEGMEFFNLKTLFGVALTSEEVVISNTPDDDPRKGGLPEGHPALNAFLGIPIKKTGKLFAIAFADGKAHNTEKSADFPDGKHYFEITASPLRNAEGKIINGIEAVRDVTERKRYEEERESLRAQLLQAQKMEAVGRLAGGVAHDFNNMLGVIIGYAQLSIAKTPAGEDLHNDLQEIINAARRSTDLTQQLLAFARKQNIDPRVLDLNDITASLLNMLQRLIGEDVRLVWQPGPNLSHVKMDPAQVDQLLVNLTVNARDAIDGVGIITVETENVLLDEAYCRDYTGFVPGDYVMLVVSDDGRGISRQDIDQIFEPFFTTKDTGKGTGLGLSTVYGIIKQNNGFINVYSEPSQGTTLRIYLPAAQTEETAQVPVREILASGGDETVLIVEDEEEILNISRPVLEKAGYTVLSCNNPTEALRLAGEYQGHIHLLVTDVIMPLMNGKDLRDRLVVLRPEIKVLFMSGYTADVIAERGVLEAGVNFLQKPFSVNELSTRVREVLDSTTA